MTDHTIRPTTKGCVPGLQSVLEKTELFPPALLPDLLAPFLTDHATAVWLTCHVANTPVGFCYAVPEPMTDGTWNLRAIAVAPAHQRCGLGAALVARVERRLHDHGQRLLIVDTSGADAFQPVRQFYGDLGYSQEARLPDFWAPGDDKVTFVKRLSSATGAS